jgi:L-rhamnose mutarotase
MATVFNNKDAAADEGFQVLEEVFNLDDQLAAESTTT